MFRELIPDLGIHLSLEEQGNGPTKWIDALFFNDSLNNCQHNGQYYTDYFKK